MEWVCARDKRPSPYANFACQCRNVPRQEGSHASLEPLLNSPNLLVSVTSILLFFSGLPR